MNLLKFIFNVHEIVILCKQMVFHVVQQKSPQSLQALNIINALQPVLGKLMGSIYDNCSPVVASVTISVISVSISSEYSYWLIGVSKVFPSPISQ